jgi:hypothetical protein
LSHLKLLRTNIQDLVIIDFLEKTNQQGQLSISNNSIFAALHICLEFGKPKPRVNYQIVYAKLLAL